MFIDRFMDKEVVYVCTMKFYVVIRNLDRYIEGVMLSAVKLKREGYVRDYFTHLWYLEKQEKNIKGVNDRKSLALN